MDGASGAVDAPPGAGADPSDAKNTSSTASSAKSKPKSVVLCYGLKRGGLNKLEDPAEATAEEEKDAETLKYMTQPDFSNRRRPIFRLEQGVVWPSTKRFLEYRGWREWDPRDGQNAWNVYWRETRVNGFLCRHTIKSQRLNKFRGTNGVTLKDQLAVRVREMREQFGSIASFHPMSWVLPEERAELEKHCAGGSAGVLICKPARLSRGRNIFLFREIDELDRALSSATSQDTKGGAADAKSALTTTAAATGRLGTYKSQTTGEETEVDMWVVQEYLAKPYLISGYKFDLRLYVLVTSVWPLRAFIYKRGLCRFATAPFDLSAAKLDPFAHLTNSSINKHSSTLHADKGDVGGGCKWRLKRLLEYLASRGADTEKLWQQIKEIVLLTLLPMVGNVHDDPCAFEYFGFDVMMDESLRPYVIEVNSGPAMSMEMPQDKVVKVPLVNDIFNLLCLDALPYESQEPFECYQSRTRRRPKPSRKTDAEEKDKGASDGKWRTGLHMDKIGDFDPVFPTTEAQQKASTELCEGRAPPVHSDDRRRPKKAPPLATQSMVQAFNRAVIDSIKAGYKGKSPW